MEERLHSIRLYGERVGNQHNIYTQGPADLSLLVRALGGKIEIGSDTTLLKIHPENETTFTILIPASTTGSHDRIIIARALGHLFVHYLVPLNEGETHPPRSFDKRALPNIRLIEANHFAYGLLVPPTIAAPWLYLAGDPQLVAKHYGVSEQILKLACRSPRKPLGTAVSLGSRNA